MSRWHALVLTQTLRILFLREHDLKLPGIKLTNSRQKRSGVQSHPIVNQSYKLQMYKDSSHRYIIHLSESQGTVYDSNNAL